ncbi:MAG: peptidoglycan editing factor PgeF [Candidatus Gracilibacteria bacterium]|nr:peptidoglycan editing factor PgeF [Candidatus Gracilibacteria bacterium]
MKKIKYYLSNVDDGNLALHIGDDKNIVLDNRAKLAKKLDKSIDDFVYMNQIHSGISSIVNISDKGIGTLEIDENMSCDSLVTNEKGLVLSVLVADCVPVLFYDDNAGVVGVAHAGWKGTVQKVLENTIKNMLSLGANIDDINVIIGPCISIDSYEVGKYVGCQFRQEVIIDKHDGKQNLDLTRQNYLDLLDLGIKADNIEIINVDTFTNSNYFSARRDGFNNGRFGYFIYIK